MSKQKDFPTVFMACSNDWRSPLQVGSHHIAKAFLKAGFRVGYVSDPVSPLHFMKNSSPQIRARFALHAQGGELSADGRLWAYVPFALATPYRAPFFRSQAVMRHWHRWSIPNVAALAHRKMFGAVDLLYIDSVYQAFWLDSITYKKAVFRIPDRNAGFPRSTPAYLQAEREIARRVDLVVYSAKNLQADVAQLGVKAAQYLPNGVDYDFFKNTNAPKPAEYAAMTAPIAVYVGAMEEWFDFALVNHVVNALPQVAFVLIGPDHLARKRLHKRPNLFLLGPRAHSDLPGYLRHAQVGLIPFNVAQYPQLVHGINPLKLYEYMACGLPVVSTAWDELWKLQSPAVLCTSPVEFSDAIAQTLTKSTDRPSLENFAASKSWSVQLQSLIEFARGENK